jgi:hypothetical protein
VTKRNKKPRVVHVTCPSPRDFQWLRQNVRGAVRTEQGYEVTNESQWAECLRAAGGKEVK